MAIIDIVIGIIRVLINDIIDSFDFVKNIIWAIIMYIFTIATYDSSCYNHHYYFAFLYLNYILIYIYF